MRQALSLLLEREGFDIVGEAGDGQEALHLARELRPDVAVLDVHMPVMNGVEAARQIHQVSPKTRTVLLAGSATEAQVVEALRAGVRAFVAKSTDARELIRGITEASRGSFHLSPSVSMAVVEACLRRAEAPADPLTPRERQVLRLIAEGKTTKEAAGLLGISVKTVESHRTRIVNKLGIHETAGLVRYAIRRGLSEL